MCCLSFRYNFLLPTIQFFNQFFICFFIINLNVFGWIPVCHRCFNRFDYARSGYAVFASSNAESASTCHLEKAVSLYTYCFSNALCHAKIRNGKVSLIDVAKQAEYMESLCSPPFLKVAFQEMFFFKSQKKELLKIIDEVNKIVVDISKKIVIKQQ